MFWTRVRDKLLERGDLTQEKAFDIIRNSEAKAERAKAWSSIGDTDVHAMGKGTRPKQFGKRGSVAERARPRERPHAKTGTVLTVCFVERHTTKPGARNAETVKD